VTCEKVNSERAYMPVKSERPLFSDVRPSRIAYTERTSVRLRVFTPDSPHGVREPSASLPTLCEFAPTFILLAVYRIRAYILE
jgi:hypothetical protein